MKNVSCIIYCFSLMVELVSAVHADAPSESLQYKVDHIVGSLSRDEKIAIIGGNLPFGTCALPEFGLRRTYYADASCGIRQRPDSTSFPCTLALAATMNQHLARDYGVALGEECRHWGVDYLLGPGVNIYRLHQNGRNFEYFGADPFLASKLVVAYIDGIQSCGVGAVTKHFVANNSEWNRRRCNSVLSERALHEIYFPAFKAAVQEAGSSAVMTSYNLINGVYAPQSEWLITDILRVQWGYKGMVMSDWDSIDSAEEAFLSGLDQECPGGKMFSSDKLNPLFAAGAISEVELDRKVKTILLSNFRLGIYDREAVDRSYRANHPEVAAEVVSESIVLLKNSDNVLPITPEKYKKVALLGYNLLPTAAAGGGASMFDNKPYTTVSISEALVSLTGEKIQYSGLIPARYPKLETRPGSNPVRDYTIINTPDISAADVRKLAAEADLVVIGTGTDFVREEEGHDHPFELDQKQYDLINLVLEENRNVVVVNLSGSGVDMAPFADRVRSIVQIFFPGEHGGMPVAEVLTGKINPSGKLPFTIGRRAEDHSWWGAYLPQGAEIYEEARYGLTPSNTAWDCVYSEGIYNDYRWFDKNSISPLFAFGHGLSYTVFSYENLNVTVRDDRNVFVEVTIKNTGIRAGKEAVQFYLQDVDASIDRPIKELKGIAKIGLAPGESGKVGILLKPADFSFWHPESRQWVIEAGEFRIFAGSSSRDIRQTCTVHYGAIK